MTVFRLLFFHLLGRMYAVRRIYHSLFSKVLKDFASLKTEEKRLKKTKPVTLKCVWPSLDFAFINKKNHLDTAYTFISYCYTIYWVSDSLNKNYELQWSQKKAVINPNYNDLSLIKAICSSLSLIRTIDVFLFPASQKMSSSFAMWDAAVSLC